MARSLPVNPHDLRIICMTEGRHTTRAYNNSGQIPFPSGGSTIATAWRSATAATVAANTWVSAQSPVVPYIPGRAQVIYSIEVETTGACELALLQYFNRQQTLDGNSGIALLDYLNKTHSGSLSSAGRYRWEWPEGLVMRAGERMAFFYAVSGTTGVNWQIFVNGYDITDDFDFDASPILIVGDSICGITADTTDVRYLKREDGSVSGMWPFIVKGALAEAGKNVRLINLGIGGTNSSDWDSLVAAGRIDGIRASAMIINLGMNDASFSTLLSTTAGVDGGTKKALKAIVRAFRRLNKDRPVIINQITDTDVAARLTEVASGIYAGQSRLAAYRQDIAAAVAEMQALGWNVTLAPTNTAYSAATGTAFLSSEASGSRTHPNGTVGQPAMAQIITSVLLPRL